MTTPAPGTVPAIDPAVNPIKKIVQQEPVLVSYGVTWVLANVGEFLIGHTHLITNAQWDGVTTTVAPLVTTAVIGFLATLTRKYVSPVVKKLDPSLFQ